MGNGDIIGLFPISGYMTRFASLLDETCSLVVGCSLVPASGSLPAVLRPVLQADAQPRKTGL